MVFGATRVHGIPDGVVVQGSERDWVGHPMTFTEWLYRAAWKPHTDREP
ncbi:hypothetical protein BJY54_005116 [Streptomyces nodosus]|nr:hypothetical protein [Streptomyces nodosus]